MRVGVTGADGFLGWHIQCRLKAFGHTPVPATRATFADTARLAAFAADVDAIVHAAGVNRAFDEADIAAGNRDLAGSLADAISTAPRPIPVIYTNSTQSESGNLYGDAKQAAAETLGACQHETGGAFVDLVLPHLFGEFGRPFYNSAVTTFAHVLATGGEADINRGGALELLHAQDVASYVIDALQAGPTAGRVRLDGRRCSVGEVWDLLERQHHRYVVDATVPHFSDRHELQIFNALRSQLWGAGHYPLSLALHGDARGGFAELMRADGTGQTSFSTSGPEVTRGDHFHFDKIERFVVVRGRARIRLRRLLSDTLLVFDVDGGQPVAIDMPPLWTHNITNTGQGELVTVFWAGDHFDPAHPDTYPEPVETTA